MSENVRKNVDTGEVSVESGDMGTKNRQANFELLRVIAMLMVVTMHYLIKGNVAVSMAEDGGTVKGS